MQINSKLFILCFLSIYQFCKSEDLIELKSNTTLTNDTIQLSSSYCKRNSDCSDLNENCVDNECRCAPNYKYNYLSHSCQYSSCTWNSDCQTYDYNRYCSYGTCYCYSGYYADYSNGQKCTTINAYSYDFTWVWILVAIVIMLKIFFIIYYVRRRRRYLAALRASQQPVIIVGNTGYGSTSYQSNQFPAGYPQNFNNPPPPPYSIR
jgi:hypothetical protein